MLPRASDLLGGYAPAAVRLLPETEGKRPRRRDRSVARDLAESRQMQLVETTRISQPGARAIEPTVIAELGAPFGLALPGPFADQHHARVAILARQRETRLTTDANPPIGRASCRERGCPDV